MSSGTGSAGGVVGLAGHVLCLGAVTGAGALAWHALTRGDVAPIGSDGLLGGLGAVWLVPSVYLAAWLLLSLQDLKRALLGAAAMVGLCVATFGAAFVAGLFSFGLLALPVGAAGVVVIAIVLAHIAAADGEPAPRRWPHVVGLLVAFVGLIPAFIGTIGRYHPDVPPLDATAAGLVGMLAPFVLIFVPHGVLAWLCSRRTPAAQWRRAGAMLAVTMLVPMPLLGPGWMVALPGRIAGEYAEHGLFAAAGGWERGLYPGAAVDAAMGQARLRFVVPEGWLGLHPMRPGPEPERMIEIAPDPRRPAADPPIRRLRLTAAIDMPMIPVGAATAAEAAWHLHGCTLPDASGLQLCRQLAFGGGRGVDRDVAALLPEADLPRRMLARFETGETGWLMQAPGLNGRCHAREACRLRFAAADGVEMEAEVPVAVAPRWREIREATARLLRAAAGLELRPAGP